MSDPQKTNDDDLEASLYAKRQKIYPREVSGIFAKLRWLAVFALMGGYYLVPWFNLEGRQMLLLDLPERKFHILYWTFWPQDFFYLAAILIIAALSLFFFTAIAGRLWCGYACPQTVWTEVFMWFEHKIEGDRPKQIKLEKMPWNFYKIRTKAFKHFVWIAISLWTGLTFVGYFSPIRELWSDLMLWQTGAWETFWIFGYGFATWGNAGFMREQVCIYMCPYARFQSAMFDNDTMTVTYDEARGEPRGGRKKSIDYKQEGLGSCIDCSICVQVCPTGIDIRDGMQYECIGCAACIDACDDVMDQMGYEKGLIRYTTLNILNGGEQKILRPRVFVYASILILITSALFYSIATRIPIELDVIRDRNKLFTETYDGMIENVYSLRLINKDQKDHKFKLLVKGIEDLQITSDHEIVSLKTGEVITIAVRLKADPYKLNERSVPIQFTMQSINQTDLVKTEEAKFLGPFIK